MLQWVQHFRDYAIEWLFGSATLVGSWLSNKYIIKPWRARRSARGETSRNVMLLLRGFQELKRETKEIAKLVGLHEQMVNIFIHLSNEMMYVTDTRGFATSFSLGYLRFFDVSIERVLGGAYEHLIHPEDKEEVMLSWRRFLKSGNKNWHYFNFRFIHPETAKIWYLETHVDALLDRDGEILFYVGSIHDRTKQVLIKNGC